MHRHVYLHICLLKMNNYIVSSLKYLRFSFCWLWKVNIYRIDLFSRFIQLELLINFSFWKTSVTVLSLILCTGCFKWSYCGTTTVNNGTLLSENIYIYIHTLVGWSICGSIKTGNLNWLQLDEPAWQSPYNLCIKDVGCRILCVRNHHWGVWLMDQAGAGTQ